MLAFICILIGIVIGGGGMYLVLSDKPSVQSESTSLHDGNEYYKLWSEAVSLLGINGQLTQEQVARIMPVMPEKQRATPVSASPQLSKMDGFSSDRRKIEIMRAKKGLPPADNLEGMFSSDVRKVHKARITYSDTE